MTIAESQRLRLTVAIPEKHAASISNSTQITLTISDQPGHVLSTSLSRNGKLLQPLTRSVTVKFDVKNADMALSGGEFAQVTLKLRRPDSILWLPAASIIHAFFI